jgi:hypothetical protein
MSKGTRITPLRIPPDLLALIDESIVSNNAWRVDEEYNRTTWIIQAIKERLAKLARARRHRRTSSEQAGPVEPPAAD